MEPRQVRAPLQEPTGRLVLLIETEETTEAMTETVEMVIAAMTRRIIVIIAEMIVMTTGDLSGTAEMTVITIGGMTEEVLKRRRVIGTGRRREALRKLPFRRA